MVIRIKSIDLPNVKDEPRRSLARRSMMDMQCMSERDEGINIEQIPHGKSARRARTWSLVTLVAFGAP
jgi:hypothetical protein